MPQADYRVRVDVAAKRKMEGHARFLARVSVPAAQRLENEMKYKLIKETWQAGPVTETDEQTKIRLKLQSLLDRRR